jgi:beta-N-acetylglucosaminidase
MKIIDYNKFKDLNSSQQMDLKDMPKLKITKNGIYIKISKGLNKDLSAKDINEIYLLYQVLDRLIDEY